MFNLFKVGFNGLIERPSTQIKSLDGLRSLAVLLVISTHVRQACLGHNPIETFLMKTPFARGGWVGVDLFFCLSGFFIGRQLWKEYIKTSTIKPLNFILRRGLRIWPLYFTVFILNAIFLFYKGEIHSFNVLLPELFFLSNYIYGQIVPGSWSLSTEEQFYLVIPLLVLGICNYFKNIKSALYVFIGLFILAPFIRYISLKVNYIESKTLEENILNFLYFPFHTHIDGLIVGLVLSNMEVQKLFTLPISKIKKLSIIFFLSLFGVALRLISKTYFEYTALTLIFGSIIYFLLNSSEDYLSKFLSNRLFYVISRLSFGMYLTHQFAMHLITDFIYGKFTILGNDFNFILSFIMTSLVAMIIAFLGFSLIELPFLKLRHKIIAE